MYNKVIRTEKEYYMNGKYYISKYNILGNLIYLKVPNTTCILNNNRNGEVNLTKEPNGFERRWKYDENNNIIYSKDSNGFEFWGEYDENGNEIHYKDSHGYEKWWKYDENNNIIYSKDSNGFEYWKDYDENGNEIHYKNSHGFEKWCLYDKDNKCYSYITPTTIHINDKEITKKHKDIIFQYLENL